MSPRSERTRYYERYAFPLFSYIDFRVSDADAVRPFYDALMTLFGTADARTGEKTWTIPVTSSSTIRRSMRSSLKIHWATA